MKKKAVCIRCGAFKSDALKKCNNCGLAPKTDYEAARALILSDKFFLGDVEVGRSMDELEKIADSISQGRPYAIDGEEQKMVVRAYYAHQKAQPPPKWYKKTKVKLIGLLALCIIIVAVAAWIAVTWLQKS